MDTYDTLLSAITRADGPSQEVHDPATGELIGLAPQSNSGDLERALERATAAQVDWAAKPDEERVATLLKVADAIEQSSEALAELLSREQGKPLNGPNARFEVQACANWIRATAATPLPVEVVIDDGESYAELHYRALGVVGVITPGTGR